VVSSCLSVKKEILVIFRQVINPEVLLASKIIFFHGKPLVGVDWADLGKTNMGVLQNARVFLGGEGEVWRRQTNKRVC